MGKITLVALLLLVFFLILIDYVPNSNAQPFACLAAAGEALIDFKNGLEDPRNWLASWRGRKCCQWYGIHCENSIGAVIAIDLPGPDDSSSRYGLFNLSGEIRPPSFRLEFQLIQGHTNTCILWITGEFAISGPLKGWFWWQNSSKFQKPLPLEIS